MLRTLSSRQITEWLVYYSLEPFGSYPEWLRTGVVASTIANVHRGKGAKGYVPEDFMPKEPASSSSGTQDLVEQKSVLRGLFEWARRTGKTKEDR